MISFPLLFLAATTKHAYDRSIAGGLVDWRLTAMRRRSAFLCQTSFGFHIRSYSKGKREPSPSMKQLEHETDNFLHSSTETKKSMQLCPIMFYAIEA